MRNNKSKKKKIVILLLLLMLTTGCTKTLVDKKGNPVINKELTDTETIPLVKDIKDYLDDEVLPFVPNAWVDNSKTKLGYEITFTKYFYEYKEPRKAEDIMKEILDLDSKLDGVLKELQNE